VRCFIVYILCFPFILISQNEKKEIYAKRIDSKIIIDGKLDELFWLDINPAKNFIMIEPINGKYERTSQRTEVKFAYDNSAIYVGASLYDSNPYEILKELGPRDDQDKNTDMFGIFINPFNDGINEFSFLVTAAGVQIDKKIILTTDGYINELNWDAVWESEVVINEKGWFVEMKIPYSAIRFPNTKSQEWGLNIYRGLRRLREDYSWNYIDISKRHIGNQAGILKGIENIESPIRLSFVPYVSSQINEFNGDYNFGYNGGIDLKYGITESFTLDLTLVPDFQQVEFDPLVLNMSPFETYYDEKRSFFTEGVELFRKGDLFYSRRIGGTPSGEAELDSNEILTDSPENVKLINATKVSGRTNNGYGIGVFNAITANTYAEIGDTITNDTRREIIEPITNYNMLVLDKSFNKNSFLTFINTNVSRNNDYRNANVTGLLASITNPKNTHAINTSLKGSVVKENNENQYGFSSLLNIQKISGEIQYQIQNYIESDKYDINDMGFLYQNNEINNEVNLSYNIFKPMKNILRGQFLLSVEHKMLYKPSLYNELILKWDNHFVFTNHLFFKYGLRYFFEENDHFEARKDNQNFIRPPAAKMVFGTSSDYRKPFALNMMGSVKYRFTNGYAIWEEYSNPSTYIRFNPRIRINNHTFLEYVLAIEQEKNQFGWIPEDDILGTVFSRRNQNTLTNKLILNHTFTKKAYLKFILRHYWSTINNKSFYSIDEDGYLLANSDYTDQHDEHNINFNSWNIDLSFSWEYRPGSFLTLVWQNQIADESNEIENLFLNNINDLFENPSTNIFSVKFTYYLDIANYSKK